MSDPTVTAAVRTGMSEGARYGVSRKVTVSQQRGTYDPATGTSPTATVTSDVDAILYGKKSAKTNAKSAFEVQTAIVLVDDLASIKREDVFTIDDEDWTVGRWETDPTGSFYEIEVRR